MVAGKALKVRGETSAGVALETTLLVHGLPPESALALATELDQLIVELGALPLVIGVRQGQPIVGMTQDELREMVARHVASGTVAKANSANLGVLMLRGRSAATTVSTTMELAAAAGVRVMATGGLGGVHRGYGAAWDVSADLAAFTRFPVAVVTSGVKSILDVTATREALETLGVPVVGFRCDRFPAFYLRESEASVDARFDEPEELAEFVAWEMARTGRGVVVANPIPEVDAVRPADWEGWLAVAMRRVSERGLAGRDVTPALLSLVSELSAGETLRANLALVRSNAAVAAQIAAAV